MPYRLTRFGLVDLSQAAGRSDVGPAPAFEATVPLVDGGAFDPFGTETAPQALPYVLSYQAEFVETTVTALWTAFAALAALTRKRNRLWRTRSADGAQHWCWARLLSMPAQRTWRNLYWQDFALEFQVWSRWHGTAHGGAWNLDAGYLFDSGLYLDDSGATVLDGASPEVLTVNNGGDLAVDDSGITVTATSSAITYLKITGYDQETPAVIQTEWEFTGTIAAGTSLVVDCGDWTVLNDGVDAYGNFALTANHVIAPWLRLHPGNNTINVYFTCGDAASTITLTYSDGWA